MADKSFNINQFLLNNVPFEQAQHGILKKVSDPVLDKIIDFMDGGYPFRFAFYLAMYYCLYHGNDGAHRADDIDLDVYFFIREHSKADLVDVHPYFLFLYEKDPTLRAYFRSQKIFRFQYEFISEDPEDDGL